MRIARKLVAGGAVAGTAAALVAAPTPAPRPARTQDAGDNVALTAVLPSAARGSLSFTAGYPNVSGVGSRRGRRVV